MAIFNLITGLKRRHPVADLPRKQRSSLSPTVASRMEAQFAMDDHVVYTAVVQSGLATVAVLLNSGAIDTPEKEAAMAMIIVGSSFFENKAGVSRACCI